jgi:hypothetical protein
MMSFYMLWYEILSICWIEFFIKMYRKKNESLMTWTLVSLVYYLLHSSFVIKKEGNRKFIYWIQIIVEAKFEEG